MRTTFVAQAPRLLTTFVVQAPRLLPPWGIPLFNGEPQATAMNVVAGLKHRRLRLADKRLNLPPWTTSFT
jgi:hypothetical protein